MKQGQVLCLTVLMVLFISSGFAAGKELHVGPQDNMPLCQRQLMVRSQGCNLCCSRVLC